MSKRVFKEYTVLALPDPQAPSFDIDGIYFKKEAGKEMSVHIWAEDNSGWFSIKKDDLSQYFKKTESDGRYIRYDGAQGLTAGEQQQARENLGIDNIQSDKNFVYTQSAPASIWTINHPLGKKVSIAVTDTAGTVVEGRITINNGTQVIVEFNAPFSGEAILN